MVANISNAQAPLQVTIHPLPEGTDADSSGQFWSGDTPSFKDVLDTINPLQHIPVISTLYQSLTGDVPSSGANIVGGTLLGGVFGFAAALFNEVVKTQTGNDVGGNMLAMLSGDEETGQAAGNDYPVDYAPPPTNKAAYSAYMHAQGMFT